MRSKKQVLEKTDDRGRLRLAGLHDAQLTEFAYVFHRSLQFSLLGVGNEATIFQILDPKILNIYSLWEGSIIDTVYVWDLASVPAATWSEPENGWNALLDQRVDISNRSQEASRLIDLNPACFLLVVACSYGGSWAVMGEELSITQSIRS